MNHETVHPHIGDPVLLWGERGMIVMLLGGMVTVDRDDDVQVTAPADRLRWVSDRAAWVIVAEEAA